MTSPTPGPWFVPIHAPWQVHPVDALGGYTAIAVCYVDGWSKRSVEERDANARLIATTPELLESLQELVSCAEVYDEFHDPNHDYYVALKSAQEAIARAEHS